MRKVAASRVYLSPTHYLKNHIVTITGDRATSLRPLLHETPMTEWLQGAIILTPQTATPSPQTITDYYTGPHPVQESDQPYAWHIPNTDNPAYGERLTE